MRLGVFGGTFDPIHFGHLRMAEEAREQLGLERVLFVPNRVSPFKTGGQVTPAEMRLEMVRLAVADNPYFESSDVEVRRAGPSFAIETIRTLRASFPDAETFFITGSDALRDLPLWRESEALIAATRFAAAARPGTDWDCALRLLPESWRERITMIEMTALDISATNLRERIRKGASIRYLTPRDVEDYIRARHLYAAVDRGD